MKVLTPMLSFIQWLLMCINTFLQKYPSKFPFKPKLLAKHRWTEREEKPGVGHEFGELRVGK